jgi:hypothetical protein
VLVLLAFLLAVSLASLEPVELLFFLEVLALLLLCGCWVIDVCLEAAVPLFVCAAIAIPANTNIIIVNRSFIKAFY